MNNRNQQDHLKQQITSRRELIKYGLFFGLGLVLSACEALEGVWNFTKNVRRESEPVFKSGLEKSTLLEKFESESIVILLKKLRQDNNFTKVRNYEIVKNNFKFQDFGLNNFSLANQNPLNPEQKDFSYLTADPKPSGKPAKYTFRLFLEDASGSVISFDFQHELTWEQFNILFNQVKKDGSQASKADNRQVFESVVKDFANGIPEKLDETQFVYLGTVNH